MTMIVKQCINRERTSISPGYRADIDGLRAIAVLLVVLYHAGFPVPGGFVGVDVFFVISGYLITAILRREILDRTFTFRSFYIRRIKRLMPAYFFLLACTTVYSGLHLLPDDMISYAKSAVASLAGLSNVYFFMGTGYFGNAANEPLLHTWSIAVEEQFYVIWPMLLLALSWIDSKRAVRYVVAAILITSLVASHHYAVNHKNAAYLLLPFRFFELMVGALLALYQHRVAKVVNLGPIIAITGLTFVVASAFILDNSSAFPGIYALPVCIGTAMVIASGFNSTNHLPLRALQIPPIRYIGKVSYSLYLWHWPVLALAQYRGIALTTENALILIAVAFLASCFSYHFIETPFRNIKSKKFVSIAIPLYVVPSLLMCAGAYSIVKNDGFRSRSGELISELEDRNTSHVQRSQCISVMIVGNYGDCHLGVDRPEADGLLIGDSFANAYAQFVDVLARDAGIMIHDTTAGSTPAIPDVFTMDMVNKLPESEWRKIVDYNTARFEAAKSKRVVIISNFWNNYATWQTRFRVYNSKLEDVNDIIESLQYETIKKYLDAGVKVVILVQPFAEIGKTEVSRMREKKLRHAVIDSTYPPVEPDSDRIEYKIKDKFPQVVLVDPNKVLCENNKCKAFIDGKIIFRNDGSHLNAVGAEAIGKEYLKRFGNPLAGM
ncbi:TPA: acyltransferase family protein [Pseudomonas putida]